MRLFERLKKLRIPSHKPHKEMPLLTWEQIGREAQAELLQQIEQDTRDELAAFEATLRNLN